MCFQIGLENLVLHITVVVLKMFCIFFRAPSLVHTKGAVARTVQKVGQEQLFSWQLSC